MKKLRNTETNEFFSTDYVESRQIGIDPGKEIQILVTYLWFMGAYCDSNNLIVKTKI